MPHSSAFDRYRAEAVHALSRLRHYREQGDAHRFEQWHRTWSLAETAADAELREQGGGARVLRLRNPPPLRPLPSDFSPLTLPPPAAAPVVAAVVEVPGPTAPEPAAAPAAAAAPAEPAPADALALAMARHDLIEQALLAGGPNPLPEELSEEEWQEQLCAYQDGGPLDCELLQEAENVVEVIFEMMPDLTDEEEEALLDGRQGFESAALPECRRIYQESLADLTEDELRADLATCLQAGRADTAVLIEAEIRRREREEPPPEVRGAVPERAPECREPREAREVKAPAAEIPPASPFVRGSGDRAGVSTVAEPGEDAAATPLRATRHRRARSAPTSLTPPPARPAERREQPVPPPVETVPEPAPAGYTTAPAWIDITGRTRTWNLFGPAGEKLAEIATRRDAEKLAALFNRLMGRESPL